MGGHNAVMCEVVPEILTITGGPRQTEFLWFSRCSVAWRFGYFVPNLYPIYFCTVGTVLPYSLKIESR